MEVITILSLTSMLPSLWSSFLWPFPCVQRYALLCHTNKSVTQLRSFSSCTKHAGSNEMLFLRHVPLKVPSWWTRGPKVFLQPKVLIQIEDEVEKKNGSRVEGGCRPSNGEVQWETELMWCLRSMQCQDGCLFGKPAGPQLVSGALCTLFAPPLCTSITAIF